jgi:hypothetical protein
MVAHSFYSSELVDDFNVWAYRLQADYFLRTLSRFILRGVGFAAP